MLAKDIDALKKLKSDYDYRTFWSNCSEGFRFIVIGCLNTMIAYFLYVFLLFIFGFEEYQLSLGLTYALSSIVSFSLQRKLVFQNTDSFVKGYLRGLITWGITYVLNASLLEIIILCLNITPVIAQVIAILLSTFCSFFLFKFFVFV